VICGAMSHMCIDATVRAAADLGFGCVVIHDACATRDVEFQGRTISAQEVHGSFMAALGMAYARVLSLNEFLSKAKEAAKAYSGER
jgi:nicotinamidase-related amidase